LEKGNPPGGCSRKMGAKDPAQPKKSDKGVHGPRVQEIQIEEGGGNGNTPMPEKLYLGGEENIGSRGSRRGQTFSFSGRCWERKKNDVPGGDWTWRRECALKTINERKKGTE